MNQVPKQADIQNFFSLPPPEVGAFQTLSVTSSDLSSYTCDSDVVSRPPSAKRRRVSKKPKKPKPPAEKSSFKASAHLVSITHCVNKTRTEPEVIDRIKAFVPPYKSLVIVCEAVITTDPDSPYFGQLNWHYHIFWHGKDQWAFARSRWEPLQKWFQAPVVNFGRWNKKTGITRQMWLVEKWRYLNNLVNAAFTEAKGDDKGVQWRYNDGHAYTDQQAVDDSELKPDAAILKAFCEGVSLTTQYTEAGWSMKAYICKHWDVLTKMISNHKRCLREIAALVPKFTKANFHLQTAAEEHDFTEKVLVISGAPNTGKTQYAKTFFTRPLLVRHPDKLKSFDENVHDGIIFDDQSYGHWPRESVIHLFDVEEETDINVKNSMVTIPAGMPRIFTTNRRMQVTKEDRWGNGQRVHDKDRSFLPMQLSEDDNAITRRMKHVHVLRDLRKM